MSSSTLNYGRSSFYSILGLFCRSRDGRLLSVEGREAEAITDYWSIISRQLGSTKTKQTTLPSGLSVETTYIDDVFSNLSLPSSLDDTGFQVREMYRESSNCYIGLISHRPNDEPREAFRNWIETLFMSRTSLKPQIDHKLQPDRSNCCISTARQAWGKITALLISNPPQPLRLENDRKPTVRRGNELIAENITVLFERTLRNKAAVDEWDSSGRKHFLSRVLAFVNRNETCQMALPAFPCKSPNQAKVGGSKPDMAERIALETLRTFTKAVQRIYAPGATIWIIHDGHLLSSCIGVDDSVVSDYENNLQQLYQSMFSSPSDKKAIQFCGLSDLFFSGKPDEMLGFDEAWLHDDGIVPHPLETTASDTAELARKLTMASCGIDRTHLRKLIAAQDTTTLKVYRGLSRFMLDDLAGLPSLAQQSTSKRKKVAAAAAAEMMVRNQAYSNLLELLFPDYVRLSIHAHNNRGPKFGIRLFPGNSVRAIIDIDGRHEPVPQFDFQIPTPWHNTMVKVTGDPLAYLTKASVARQAVASGRYEGGWVDDENQGGHFLLRDIGLDASEPVRDEKLVIVTGESMENTQAVLLETLYATIKKLAFWNSHK